MESRADKDVASGTARDPADELDHERRWLSAARRNPEQFRYFYDKYFPRLHAFVLRRTGDRELTEDILGRVFVKALHHLPRFRWRGVRLGAWLYRVAANEIRDHRARDARWQTLRSDRWPESVADPGAGTLALLVRAERQQLLHECLQRLPGRDRDIIDLHYWRGYKTREVAAALRISENTVKTRLVRARAALRRLMDESDDAPVEPAPLAAIVAD